MIIKICYAGSAILFLTGIWGLIVSRDLLRLILGIGIIEVALNVFLITLAYTPEGSIPILTAASKTIVDPLPHAMVLTTIVIGLGVMGTGLALLLRYVKLYHTTSLDLSAQPEQLDD